MPRLHIDTYPTPDEYKTIQQKAAEVGMSLSQYLLFCGLNAKITVTVQEPKNSEGGMGKW